MAKKKGPRCERCGSRKTRVVSKKKLEEITVQGSGHPLIAGLAVKDIPWEEILKVAAGILKIWGDSMAKYVFCKKCGHLKEL